MNQRQQKYYDELNEVVKRKGGKLLSDTYVNNKAKVNIKCSEDHQWSVAPSSIKNSGKWCPHCAGIVKLTIEQMRQLAQERGGKCLSTRYINRDTHLLWECEYGHQWEAKPANIKCSGGWCPHCAGNVTLTIDEMRQLAQEKGGKCLSTEYISNRTHLLWECEYGHQWEAKPANIKCSGGWCPYCAGTIKLTIDEMQLLAKERGGKCISTEYINSSTHLIWECEYDHQWESIPNNIKRGNWCPHCAGRARLTIEQMRQLAHERGGKCLSIEYIDSKTHLLWECEYGHQWESTPENIKQAYWCPHCAGNVNLTIDEMRQLAKEKGGKCLSTEYTNNGTHLSWECEYGHQWNAIPSSIKCGSWCPQCGGTMILTIEQMLQLAQERGGKCLSSKYTNNMTHLLWECKYGHQWNAMPNSVKYSNTWCPVCKSSKGERECTNILTKLCIKFVSEYIDPRQLERRYDFRFVIDGNHYLIEYDGIQHFEFVEFFHRTVDKFMDRRNADIGKTKFAVKNGYRLIRIDYNELERVEFHIKEGIKQNKPLYLSNPAMYHWIHDEPSVEEDDNTNVASLPIIVIIEEEF